MTTAYDAAAAEAGAAGSSADVKSAVANISVTTSGGGVGGLTTGFRAEVSAAEASVAPGMLWIMGLGEL